MLASRNTHNDHPNSQCHQVRKFWTFLGYFFWTFGFPFFSELIIYELSQTIHHQSPRPFDDVSPLGCRSRSSLLLLRTTRSGSRAANNTKAPARSLKVFFCQNVRQWFLLLRNEHLQNHGFRVYLAIQPTQHFNLDENPDSRFFLLDRKSKIQILGSFCWTENPVRYFFNSGFSSSGSNINHQKYLPPGALAMIAGAWEEKQCTNEGTGVKQHKKGIDIPFTDLDGSHGERISTKKRGGH